MCAKLFELFKNCIYVNKRIIIFILLPGYLIDLAYKILLNLRKKFPFENYIKYKIVYGFKCPGMWRSFCSPLLGIKSKTLHI